MLFFLFHPKIELYFCSYLFVFVFTIILYKTNFHKNSYLKPFLICTFIKIIFKTWNSGTSERLLHFSCSPHLNEYLNASLKIKTHLLPIEMSQPMSMKLWLAVWNIIHFLFLLLLYYLHALLFSLQN